MISAEFEFDCAEFVLTKQFDSARARARSAQSSEIRSC